MRNMSFFHTQEAYRTGTKDVTRRLGWANLKPGEIFMGCVKCQGLKKGEKIQKIGPAICVSNTPEPLDMSHVTPGEVIREGFRGWTSAQFIRFFCDVMNVDEGTEVNRIEFRRIKNADILE